MKPSIYVNDQDLASLGFGIREARGAWDGLSSPGEGLTIPGLAGRLMPTRDVATSPRTIDLVGILQGSTRTQFLSRLDQLKMLFRSGLLEIRRDEAPTRVYLARALGHAVTTTGPVFLQRKQEIAISLVCDDPYAYEVQPKLISFGSTRVPIPCGTAPSQGVIWISPDAPAGSVVNPVVTYRNSAGTPIETLSFTRTLAIDDWEEITLSLFQVTRSVVGVTSNDLTAMAGQFFAVSPLDGDYANSVWPTLEVSAGIGLYLYRRAWQ